MAKKKSKKQIMKDINNEFQEEIRTGAEKLYNYLNDFIEGKLDDKDDKKFQEIITCEKNCDRIKERYLKILFEDKRALPFLLEDRYKIIIYVDKILNKLEFIARYLQIFPYKIFPDISSDLSQLNKSTFEIINQLLNTTLLMETNFSGAYEITFEVESRRREAHDLKFKILEAIFKKKDEPLRVNLTWKLVGLIYETISWCEEISDFLRELIIKYPGK